MLYTASFYEPRHGVGVRCRISRAHPRGRRTDWEMQPALYPSRALLTEYRSGYIDFPVLDARYREELDATLLCFEPPGEPCRRRLAAGARTGVRLSCRADPSAAKVPWPIGPSPSLARLSLPPTCSSGPASFPPAVR